MAAIVAFGVRLFNNLAIIRRQLLRRLGTTKAMGETKSTGL
jgi:small basic protein